MYLASRDYFWAAAAYSNFNFHELIKYRDAFKDLVAMGVGVLEYIDAKDSTLVKKACLRESPPTSQTQLFFVKKKSGPGTKLACVISL